MKNKYITTFAVFAALSVSAQANTDLSGATDIKYPTKVEGDVGHAYNLNEGGYFELIDTVVTQLVDTSGTDTNFFLNADGILDVNSTSVEQDSTNTGISSASGIFRVGTPYKTFTPGAKTFSIKNSAGGTTYFDVDQFRLQRHGYSNDTRVVTFTMSVESNLTVNVKTSFQMLGAVWGGTYNSPDPVYLDVKDNSTLKLVNTSGAATFKQDGKTSNDKIATVNVESGSTLDMGLTATVGGDKGAEMNINGTLIANKTMTFDVNSTLNLGGELIANDNVKFVANSTFSANGTNAKLNTVASGKTVKFSGSAVMNVNAGASLTMDSANVKFDKGSSLNVLGSMTVATDATSFSIPTLIVGENATFKSGETAIYVGQDSSISNVSAVEIRNLWTSGDNVKISSATDTVKIRKILPQENSKLILEGENVINYNYSDTEKSKIASCFTGATIELKNNQKFGELIMSNSTFADLTIDLNANTICFDSFTNEEESGAYKLFLNDFVNGSFKMKDTSVIDLQSILVDGIYTGSQLAWSGVDDNGYYSLLANVPEPAEWAAIFGALALALAVYRRRK